MKKSGKSVKIHGNEREARILKSYLNACGYIFRMPAGIRVFLYAFSPSSSDKKYEENVKKTSKKNFILHINLDG